MPIPSFQGFGGGAPRSPLSGMGQGNGWRGWQPGGGLMTGLSGLMERLGRPMGGQQPQGGPSQGGMPIAPPEGYNPGIQQAPQPMQQPSIGNASQTNLGTVSGRDPRLQAMWGRMPQGAR